MKKKILATTLAALLILSSSSVIKNASAESNEVSSFSSPKWRSEVTTDSPQWFKENVMNEVSIGEVQNQYNFVHNNGIPLSEKEISPFIEGGIEILPDENNKKSNLVAVGYYTVNGQIQTDFYFSNIDSTPIKDIRKRAIEVASEEYNITNSFTKKNTLTETNIATDGIVAAVPSGTSYVDTFHWTIYSDTEKYSNGTYVVAGSLDSTVEYTKQGSATLSGKTVSIWDVKASNQTKPLNEYQTRQITSRHTVEAFVPDQKLLSYGPTTTTSGSNFSVSLTGGLPTISWNFSRQTVDVIDSGSLSSGYGKWLFDFPLGTTVAKSSYLMQPGIRISNATGMVKFQHSHSGYYYKNLSYQGNGVSGLVNREFADL